MSLDDEITAVCVLAHGSHDCFHVCIFKIQLNSKMNVRTGPKLIHMTQYLPNPDFLRWYIVTSSLSSGMLRASAHDGSNIKMTRKRKFDKFGAKFCFYFSS